MKISSVASVVLLAIAVSVAFAQDNASDLPAAPSAVKQGQQPPPAQQTTPPADSKPADATPASTTSAPVTPKTPAEGNASSGPIIETPADSNNADNNADDPAARFILKVNEVNVVFTVTDRHGRLIKDLNRQDFKVIDDGRPDTRITEIGRASCRERV